MARGRLEKSRARTTSNCSAYFVGGTASTLVAGPVTGASETRWSIGRCCRVTCTSRSRSAAGYLQRHAVVRRADGRTHLRLLHLDLERVRVESGFEVKKMAGGTNVVLRRRYDVTVCDGALNIDIWPGGTGEFGPIMNLVQIERDWPCPFGTSGFEIGEAGISSFISSFGPNRVWATTDD